MSTDNDLRATLQAACVAGPDALRSLFRERGEHLAARFNGVDRPSILGKVLRSMVLGDAPLEVLDALEEHVPGLELNKMCNGITTLISLENRTRKGRPDEPDEKLRARIMLVVRGVMRHIRPGRLLDSGYLIRRYPCSKGKTLPQLALEYHAYYVFEAFCPGGLVELANSVLFSTRYGLNVCCEMDRPAQDVMWSLIKTAPMASLEFVQAQLLEAHEGLYKPRTGRRALFKEDLDRQKILIVQNNLCGVMRELDVRRKFEWLRLAVSKGRTCKGSFLPCLCDELMQMIRGLL